MAKFDIHVTRESSFKIEADDEEHAITIVYQLTSKEPVDFLEKHQVSFEVEAIQQAN